MKHQKQYRFKRNETFYIRDGWFGKAINAINENKRNIFRKNDGVEFLGIGANMVKSLKYWLQAADIIDKKINSNRLTDFGKLLNYYDSYLDKSFSWFLIHYFLVTNEFDCEIFWYIFNSNIKDFKKETMRDTLIKYYLDIDNNLKEKYIENDFNVFLKSYVIDKNGGNPEDNYICPLSYLKLLEKRGDIYHKRSPLYNELSYLIVFYALQECFNNKSFNIEDSLNTTNSPFRIFNLEKNTYLQYLDDIKRHGLITVNKTAGLNIVYFEKKLELKDIFRAYFGGYNNV